jgi:hypothetical protein
VAETAPTEPPAEPRTERILRIWHRELDKGVHATHAAIVSYIRGYVKDLDSDEIRAIIRGQGVQVDEPMSGFRQAQIRMERAAAKEVAAEEVGPVGQELTEEEQPQNVEAVPFIPEAAEELPSPPSPLSPEGRGGVEPSAGTKHPAATEEWVGPAGLSATFVDRFPGPIAGLPIDDALSFAFEMLETSTTMISSAYTGRAGVDECLAYGAKIRAMQAEWQSLPPYKRTEFKEQIQKKWRGAK